MKEDWAAHGATERRMPINRRGMLSFNVDSSKWFVCVGEDSGAFP